AWTIERMSILWEEEGSKEVFVQGFGSLFVAVLAYLCMDNDFIRHWAFNFLGVHAFIMAGVLAMGQYTGYRLSELKRFRPLADQH
ncbi:MAG TPA: gonadoliberin III, partial [Gammaproteobacteria bacterium]|nr:gonadoliberin III [Gammaproteobacteria bacterium]